MSASLISDESSGRVSLRVHSDTLTKLHGDYLCKGEIKKQAEDFVVEEILGFDFTEEGEHHLLWIEKTNTNTAFVAEQLAKFSGIALRDISYAGRKDKYALTRQYFSVYQGKHSAPDWTAFSHPDIRILRFTRHNKKLRNGALKGNRFTITIRNIEGLSRENLVERLDAITRLGVPNYYGQQRFGEMITPRGLVLDGNLQLGLRMAGGESIKNRNKRSMAISALRSYLFNVVVSERIKQHLHLQVLSGDALQLAGSNSYFIADSNDDMPPLAQRLKERDVYLTAPLCGRGKPATKDSALTFEQSVLSEYKEIGKCLANLGLKHERRAILLYPQDLAWKIEDNCLNLSFTLDSGCFATSVLREIVDIRADNREVSTHPERQ